MRYWPAAWRYWRSRTTSGSDGFTDSSTARMTTEPLWRMTSRVALCPPGSMTVSVKTLKTFPLNASLEETSFALPPGALWGEAEFEAAFCVRFLARFAGDAPACAWVRGLAIGLAVDYEADSRREGFDEAAIRLRYHPASGAQRSASNRGERPKDKRIHARPAAGCL